MIADKLARLESIKIKGKFDYNSLQSLSTARNHRTGQPHPRCIPQRHQRSAGALRPLTGLTFHVKQKVQ